MISLNQIEKEIDIDKIRHNEDCIWPIIKSYLITLEPAKSEILKKPSLSIVKILIKNLFLDVFLIFRIFKSNIWVFTNSERRYAIKSSYFDRVSSGLLNYFDKYVLFENPIPKGRSKNKTLQEGEYLIGMSWIFLIEFLFMKITKKPKIKHIEVLEEHLKLDLSKIEKIYHRYHIGYIFYNFLFKLRKPKAIFLVCYYSNFGLIKACKKNNIPVFELQHGIVTHTHRAYNYSYVFGDLFLPDYFLGYGSHFNNIVVEGNLVNKENTLNYGYSFLYEANNKLDTNREIEELKEVFSKVICITGQLESTDEKLLRIIGEVADHFKDICFIYKPRNKGNKVSFSKKKNLLKRENINTYSLLKHCDYHLTIYSTCAIESIGLGTPNIAIDIDGLFSTYLKGIIGKNKHNHTVQNKQSLISLLNSLKYAVYDSTKVAKSINNIISPMISEELFFDFFNKVIEKKPNH